MGRARARTVRSEAHGPRRVGGRAGGRPSGARLSLKRRTRPRQSPAKHAYFTITYLHTRGPRGARGAPGRGSCHSSAPSSQRGAAAHRGEKAGAAAAGVPHALSPNRRQRSGSGA
eukprot:11360746-Alexandrium_andersonii.AAC.1